MVELAEGWGRDRAGTKVAAPIEKKVGRAVTNDDLLGGKLPVLSECGAQAEAAPLRIMDDAVHRAKDGLTSGWRRPKRVDAGAKVQELLPGKATLLGHREDIATVPYRHQKTPSTIKTAIVETAKRILRIGV